MPLTKITNTAISGISNSSDATAITIDSSEKVGIGTTSPDGALHVKGASDHGKFILEAGGTAGNNNTIFMQFHVDNGTEIASIQVEEGATNEGQIIFKTGGTTEAMRIDKDGRLFFNTGGAEPSASQAGVRISGIDGQNLIKTATTSTGGYDQLLFLNGNGIVGSISTSGSNATYNTTSDYRLKENVITDYDATTRLKQLKPSRFNFKADKDTILDGFLAHEVQSIVPEAVTGEKDGVDADGNPKYQGIDQSKLVPLLVKTIQELEARIAKLESK